MASPGGGKHKPRIDMALDEQLLQRFRETDYIVDDDPPLIMQVGIRNDAIRTLFASFSVECGAFLTAWNPADQKSSIDDNYDRQAELLHEIELLRLNYLVGQGIHPSGDWQEDSYLVLGIQQAESDELCRQFKQSAYLWLPNSGVPELQLPA